MLARAAVYFLVFVVIFSATSNAQYERYTNGAENGYTWLAMDDPSLLYNTSKENYLSSILNRMRITGERYPEVSSLGCRTDIDKLFSRGKSEEFSLGDVVNEIDGFYFERDNLVIPIIFAYCYTIKKFAGASAKELNEYKEKVLLFCNE